MELPTLRVDMSYSDSKEPGDESISARLLTPGGARQRARTLSQAVLPSLRISVTPDVDKPPTSPQDLPGLAISHGASRARNESRKLLAHLLGQLQRRPMPPPIFEFGNDQSGKPGKGLGAIVKSVKGTTGPGNNGSDKKARKAQPSGDSDDDFSDEETDYNTDFTFDLMAQLKDVLIISVAQGWDLFVGDSDTLTAQPQRKGSDKSPSFLSGRRSSSRSRSGSPQRGASVKAPQLLAQCIDILSSVVVEDCRFQISSPRPSKPPNALQTVTLDVAQFLIHTHRHDARTVSRIGFAVIPAFLTFRSNMHARLLTFFEEGVLGGMLDQLQSIRGSIHSQSPSAGEIVMYGDNSVLFFYRTLSWHTGASYDVQQGPPLVSIMVEEAQEETPSSATWRRWTSPVSNIGIRSTNAPDQEIAVYYLSSLVAPLLAVILENVSLSSSSTSTLHHFQRFFRRLISYKPDVYLDLLGVVAYHTPKARHSSVSLLMACWPKAVGHLAISKALPEVGHPETFPQAELGPSKTFAHDHSHAHQFMLWHFTSNSLPAVFDGFAQDECRACSERIQGFGLWCPFCTCAVHFDCYDYPEGSYHTQYSVESEPDIQKVAVHRFCYVLSSRRNSPVPIVRKELHTFRMANVFSLTLCFVCLQPLWGCVSQGLMCSACGHFVHSTCLKNASSSQLPRCNDSVISSTHMTITWAALRRSFADHYREVFLTEADLVHKTHEDISIFLSVLKTELQILENGIALGSVVVLGDNATNWASKEDKLDEFELHYLVKLYEAYSNSGRLLVSSPLIDYVTENRLQAHKHMFYFHWNTLAYITSIIKQPTSSIEPSSSFGNALLSVSQPELNVNTEEDASHPFEVVSLAHIRNQLGSALNIHSEAAARHLLTHLLHTGLLERLDCRGVFFDGTPHTEQVPCCFPLPFGFDISADIETLVAAIEACLSDLNLSVNEVGLLLLVRRFWPDGMLSDYTFRRITKALLAWISSEDDSLVIMLRDYIAKGRSLPGVRSGGDAPSWPATILARPTGTSSANNGGDYVATRKALLNRYVAPWMLAFHDQDPAVYATTVYDLLSEHAEEGMNHESFFTGAISEEAESKRQSALTDRILRLIIKTSQASVVFTAFDDLFHCWLQRAHILSRQNQSIPSLPRLFGREAETSQRYSTIIDARTTVADFSALANSGPLRALMDFASSSKDGFRLGLQWLCLFVASGVDISVSSFMQFASLASQRGANLEECVLLAKAGLWSSWLRSLGRQDLQAMVAALNAHLTAQILGNLQSKQKLPEVLEFIRYSLATCLLLYGCNREALVSLGMIKEADIHHLPSRRKIQGRATTITDPIIVDAQLMNALRSYVQVEVDEVSCLIAQFLNEFINDTPLVESHEVDNFVLRNGSTLCVCVWRFYGIQSPEISIIRPALLARTLVVDPQPLQTLLADLLDSRNEWELRLQAVLRLFRMILDSISPVFEVEARQWRPNVIDIFYYFFSSLWTDEREEVRTAVDTWSQTLLPAHMEAIAHCWNEALSKAPISERVRLVSFLTHLHSHFPTWRVLWWGAIIDTLLENDGSEGEDPAAAHMSLYGLPSSKSETGTSEMDTDLVTLRVSLISLSLRMVADGISIDILSLLRLKDQLLRTLGFQNVVMVPSPNGQTFHVQYESLKKLHPGSYSCLTDLTLLLDSPHPLDLAPSAMGGPFVTDNNTQPMLVGSAFVDVLLDLFIQTKGLMSLPPITLKDMIRALITVIYKHNFDHKPLWHVQSKLRHAVRQALDLALAANSLSYELRELALSVCQAFIKKWHTIQGSSNVVCDAIEAATKLMVSLDFEQNVEDVLVAQTKSFLETTLTMFSMGGVINTLFKRRLEPSFFIVLRYILELNAKSTNTSVANQTLPLRDALLQDTFVRILDNDVETLQPAVENICAYMEVVHHSKYSAEQMQLFGQCLINIARKTAEWPVNAFDPSPLILVVSTLIQNNKAQSRELLTFLDTFLRAALTRFHVSAPSIGALLRVTSSLYRKGDHADHAYAANHVAQLTIEHLCEALRGRARSTALTLTSIVEVIVPSADGGPCIELPLSVQQRLIEDGMHYLQTEIHELMDFTISQTIARMILEKAETQPEVLNNLRGKAMSVRSWNMILLAAFAIKSNTPATILLGYFQPFCLAYYQSLNNYHRLDSEPHVTDLDISRAYAAMKLWLLLSQKLAQRQEGQAVGSMPNTDAVLTARMVWNELWPPFESIVYACELETHAGHISPLASSIWSSVTDLFLFLRQSRSAVSLEMSSQMALLHRLRIIGRAESKVSRVLRSINDPPPDVTFEHFVTQTKMEIWAEERLEAAKRQEASKNAPEKIRRVVS